MTLANSNQYSSNYVTLKNQFDFSNKKLTMALYSFFLMKNNLYRNVVQNLQLGALGYCRGF